MQVEKERKVTFICGLPRSGTTWLGKIFDSHPETIYYHEPDKRNRLNAIPPFVDRKDFDEYKEAIEMFVRNITKLKLPEVVGKYPIFPKNYYSKWQFLIHRYNISLFKLLSKLNCHVQVPTGPDFNKIQNIHLIWKSITSIGRIGVIVRNLDYVRTILLIRHPCGQIASTIRGDVQGKLSSSTPSSEAYGVFENLLNTKTAVIRGLTMDTLKKLHPVERLAWRWVLSNELALDEIAENKNCMLLRYEDLATSPLEISRTLFDFVGLSWSEQTEIFIRSSTSHESKNYYSVYKDSASVVEKWNRELSKQDVERISAIVNNSCIGKIYSF